MANAAITIDLNAKIANFETELRRATGSLDRFEKKGSQIASTFKSAFVGLVPAAGVAGLAAFAKSTIDAADSLNDLSVRTGVAVKTLAGYQLAAEQSGTSLDSLGRGIQKLGLSIGQAGQGMKEQAEALARLGVTARDPQQAFEQLADAVANSNDPLRTNADLQSVLGRSYVELLPLLQQGSKGLRDSAEASASFADAMARLAPDADRFNDLLAQLKTNVAGASSSVLADMLPALNEWIGSTSTLIERHGTLLGLLASLGAAAVPGITAGQLAGSVSEQAFREQLAQAKADLAEIDATKKSGTFGLIQLALYGSRESMEKQRVYLQGQIKTLESSLAQFRQRQANANKPAAVLPPELTPPASGKKSSKKSAPADPLASIISQTDTARAAEYEKLLVMLDARFDSGRRNAQQFREAIAVLNKQFALPVPVDPLGSGSFITTSQQVAEFIREQQQAINGLNGEIAQDGARAAQEYASALESLVSDTTLAKTQKLHEQIAILDNAFFDGVISAQQLDEALARLNRGTADEVEKVNDVAKELGLSFNSAFEDAVAGGKDFRDVLDGIAQDIQKIIVRKTITEPLGNAFGNLLGGIDFGSLFGFANGGVMTSAGPLPLRSYASGGIASSPQLALFGEGRMNEAFVPLPDGRRIPVQMQGAGNVQVNIIESAGRGGETERRQNGDGGSVLDIYVEQIKSSIAGDISRGSGAIPQSMQSAYGLGRVAGAY